MSMQEAAQELTKVVTLAIEISDKRIKQVDIQYHGSIHMVDITVRPAEGNTDIARPAPEWSDYTWLDNPEAHAKLRYIRQRLEGILAESNESRQAQGEAA